MMCWLSMCRPDTITSSFAIIAKVLPNELINNRIKIRIWFARQVQISFYLQIKLSSIVKVDAAIIDGVFSLK